MDALPELGRQLATQLSALVCHCKSKTPEQALLALLAAFGLGALCGFLASGKGKGKKRRGAGGAAAAAARGESDEEEDSDDDEEEEEDEAPAAGGGGIRDFSLLSAPFKMVLCVNMELNMGKGA